jgi:hypothetical protein
MDPLTQELRLLCRDEGGADSAKNRTGQPAPASPAGVLSGSLEAFDEWTDPPWEFVLAFPTPQALATAGSAAGKFLTPPVVAAGDGGKRLEIFARADQFKASPAIGQAKRQLALTLCKVLVTLANNWSCIANRSRSSLKSIPTAIYSAGFPEPEGPAPRLLAAVGSDPPRYGTPQALQCIAGPAPVSYQSGKLDKVRIRWACDKFMRSTVHLWADCFRHASAWGQAYYAQKRSEGMSHACALRCLGQRLLKIIFRIISDKVPYDAELHARNQTKHGSWVVKLAAQHTS